jgi:hypothetical protein
MIDFRLALQPEQSDIRFGVQPFGATSLRSFDHCAAVVLFTRHYSFKNLLDSTIAKSPHPTTPPP